MQETGRKKDLQNKYTFNHIVLIFLIKFCFVFNIHYLCRIFINL